MPLCPVCDSPASPPFFAQHGVPTQEGFLHASRDAAVDCTLGDIVLRFCDECGHIWNAAFDPDKLRLDPEYDISMFYSPAYRAYVSDAIERLKSRYDLAGRTALEIACGKGDFLRLLVEHGFAEAIGFDPTFDPASLSPEERERITAYRAYYDESYRGLKVDLVACRSSIQYFARPGEFLKSVRRTLVDQPSTVVYFESPNGGETFRERMVWNVVYEHACFFTPASYARLFRESGFDVLDIGLSLGGSQMELEGRPAAFVDAEPTQWESREAIAQMGRDVAGFAMDYARHVESGRKMIASHASAGRKVAMWGAGARAIGFLNNVPGAADAVIAVADINPKRQGRFLPKCGTPVVPPERLRDLKPDVVIATNPNFASEIRGQLDALGMACAFDALR